MTGREGRGTMIRIEPATPEDYPAFEALFVELRTGEAPPSEPYFVREIAPHTVIARAPDGEVAGYAFFQHFGPACYVRHLVTAPAFRRKGVGRLLMAEIAARARARDARRWQLNVKIDNVPAVALYRSLGMQHHHDTVVVRLPWSRLESFRPDADGASFEARAPRPDELEATERAFDMPAGILATNLADQAKIVRVALRDGAVHALAAFDPGFPGAFPFRARDGASARALLDALRLHARPIEDAERPWRADAIQLVCEGMNEVADALLAAGATLVFRLAHLEGALPV